MISFLRRVRLCKSGKLVGLSGFGGDGVRRRFGRRDGGGGGEGDGEEGVGLVVERRDKSGELSTKEYEGKVEFWDFCDYRGLRTSSRLFRSLDSSSKWLSHSQRRVLAPNFRLIHFL